MTIDHFVPRQKTAWLKDQRRFTIGQIILVLLPVCFVLFLSGCREYQTSDDPSLRLTFSADTVRLDTVFTEQGSATYILKVHNKNANAIKVDRVILASGEAFRVNIDGEADLSRLKALTIYGGDSALVFVRIRPEALHENNPILIEDKLSFQLASGATQ